MKRRFGWHLCHGINGNLSALGVSLTITVEHFKGDFLNVQCLQCPYSVPYRYRWDLKLCPVGLRQHEPVTTEHEPFKRDFGFRFLTVRVLFLECSRAANG